MNEKLWIIWSNEHHGWWGHSRHGYHSDRRLAGTYTQEEAEQICRDANIALDHIDVPHETMVPYE